MRIVVAITGASGAVYGWEILKYLKASGHEVHTVISDYGWHVLQHECSVGHSDISAHVDQLYDNKNLASAIASGSFRIDAMVVVPCSMRTLGAIAHGLADNLISRAADVTIKERRRLVLVPRETPMSSIHLENMLKLSNLGVAIVPACPGFYHRPATLDDLVKIMVGRICDSLNIANDLFPRWGGM